MLSVLCCLAVSATPCWEEGKLWEGKLSAGTSNTIQLGVGNVRFNCFGGNVSSYSMTPRWELILHGEGATNFTEPVTYVVNSSTPYVSKVFDKSLNYSLELVSYNAVQDIYFTFHYDVVVDPTPYPTEAPDVPQYDEAEARVAAYYAAASYAPPEQILLWNLSQTCLNETKGFNLVKGFDGSDHYIYTPYSYVGVDADREWIVMSFTGTNGTADSLADLIQVFHGLQYYDYECRLNEHISGHTHSGFCVDYQVLQALDTRETLMDLMKAHPTYRVLITGHSLGGALATLFLTDIVSLLRVQSPGQEKRIFSYTFGTPRTSDGRLSGNMPHQYRVTHAADVIVHLVMCCAYNGDCIPATYCPYHTLQEVWYPGDMKPNSNFTVCSATDAEDNSCRYVS